MTRKHWLTVTLPVIFLAILLYKTSVNIPFWDEWELVPIFHNLHSGHFFFSDFWRQHNEHRLLFSTLVLVGIANLTHWNLQIESFVSLIVAAGSFVLLLNILGRNMKLASRKEILLVFLLALIWFSPVQMENWLWGWQLEWFLNVLGVMLMAYGISRIKGRRLSYASLLLLLTGGVLAQYSLGNGTLVWPIVTLFLIYKRVRPIQILVTAMTGLLTTGLYYFHYANNIGEPSKTLALHQPIHFIQYVLGYLGRPLSFYHKPAMAIGFMVLVTFITFNIYLFIREKSAFNKNLPWVFLGLYAIGSALITGLARLGFGVGEAFSSRYTTVSLLLTVSIIMICWNNRQVLQQLLKHNYKIVWPLAALGIFSLVFIEAAWGVHAAKTKHQQLLASQQCTHSIAPTPSCLLSVYPNPGVVSGRLSYIKSIQWGGY